MVSAQPKPVGLECAFGILVELEGTDRCLPASTAEAWNAKNAARAHDAGSEFSAGAGAGVAYRREAPVLVPG